MEAKLKDGNNGRVVRSLLTGSIFVMSFLGDITTTMAVGAPQSQESRTTSQTALQTIPLDTPAESVALPGESNLMTDIRALELQVLGKTPGDESVDDRVSAMEVHLFGQKSTDGLFLRLSKIRDALRNGASSTAKSSAPPIPLQLGEPGASSPTLLPKEKPMPGSPAAKAEQLRAAHQMFEDKNYKGARKLIEGFIAKNPLDYNGYYLLGLTVLKDHSALPEYDQYAFNQFLKGLYLDPRGSECRYVCDYVVNIEHHQRVADRRMVCIPTFSDGGPQSLLNVGVDCFIRDDETNARDLFDFVIKYAPGAAASGYYNLGAMEERHGQLQPALKHYKLALTACRQRNRLYANRLLMTKNADKLPELLILRTIQRVGIKIKSGDRAWTGVEQVKGATMTARCTINRMSATDFWADLRDAGVQLSDGI